MHDSWENWSPEERLVAEQAVLGMRELARTCDAAPDGKVLAACEAMAMQQGRRRSAGTFRRRCKGRRRPPKIESPARAENVSPRPQGPDAPDSSGRSAGQPNLPAVRAVRGRWICAGRATGDRGSVHPGGAAGGCKNLIGKRLKHASPRRRVMRVNRMAGPCAVMCSNPWQICWNPITN